MSWWRRKRKEQRDRHREFIYLDEVSVVSLLAALQGEISQSVTDTLARADESTESVSMSAPKGMLSAQSKTVTTRSSGREVVRRAVIQSTFRDLWRSDVGVILHGARAKGKTRRAKVSTVQDLKRDLKNLRRDKLAVELEEIERGSILEMDVQLDADRFFKLITVGTNFLDLIEGKEDLFGISAEEVRRVSPMIQVLKEFCVGLVPVRAVSTSHYVVELDGVPFVIAREVFSSESELLADAREIELVGFTETDSYWRDLRRTLFSGSIYTAYMRVEKSFTNLKWNPIKIADLFEEVESGLGDRIAASLQEIGDGAAVASSIPDVDLSAEVRMRGFAKELANEIAATPDPDQVEEKVGKAALALSNSESDTDCRRAFDLIVDVVAGNQVDRELVRRIREHWINRVKYPEIAERVRPLDESKVASRVQLEVGFVALYW